MVPSEWYENSPLVIYEPFALGTPVIGARIGGIPEFITPGENGDIFESGNIDELGAILNRYLAQPDELKQMGRKARAFAEKNFMPESHAESMLRLYSQCIDRGVAGVSFE